MGQWTTTLESTLRKLITSAQDTADLALALAKAAMAGGGATTFADNETPSGTINGSNTAFTLAHTPNPAGSLILALNDGISIQGVDYSISGAAITMTVAPLTGETLRALTYRY